MFIVVWHRFVIVREEVERLNFLQESQACRLLCCCAGVVAVSLCRCVAGLRCCVVALLLCCCVAVSLVCCVAVFVCYVFLRVFFISF